MELTTEDRKALQGAMNVLAEILQQASPEVPATLHEWPNDDTHLQGEFWKDTDGDIYRFSDGHWEVWHLASRQWVGAPALNNDWAPFTRTTDPSLPRTWDTPEVPDRVEEWPNDDTHLRGEFWKDKDGDVYSFSDGQWEVWRPAVRQWWEVLGPGLLGNLWAPYTRTTDPSLPRTWDTLDDVPEDVERVTGDEAGTRREFARSPLSESGWFLQAKVGPFSGWVELLVDRTKYVKNIREDQ